jgi:probable phosphoglycerate mutase
MSILFHLIRHGDYPLLDHALGGRADHPLSEEGRAQADQVARWLAPRTIAAVVSSPVRRAQETALPVAHRFGCQVTADDAFTEIDFAGWSGKRFQELADDPAWQAWNRFRGTAGVPGGETMLAVQSRALAALLKLAGNDDREIAIITHADVIKAILCHFLGVPLDLMGRLDISPGSISQVALYQQDARVLGMNLRP